jgi:hypothetical protein
MEDWRPGLLSGPMSHELDELLRTEQTFHHNLCCMYLLLKLFASNANLMLAVHRRSNRRWKHSKPLSTVKLLVVVASRQT